MFNPHDLEWMTALSDYLSTSAKQRPARRSEKGKSVYGGTHRIETEIAEIFESEDVEWITAVSMMVDVMYQQFIRERRQGGSNTVVLEKIIALSGAKMIPPAKQKVSRAA
jgi:cytochrome b subunit of formate dehydrogenase